jgi:hypothetical protein
VEVEVGADGHASAPLSGAAAAAPEEDEVMRLVFDRPYAFMYADTSTGENYKNFDHIDDTEDQDQDSHMV